MASSLTSAFSSMEVMLDALMQRGIGKPEEKTKKAEPPALPTRPTVRGRLPSLHRPGAPAPWIHRPPLSSLPPPQVQEEEEEKYSVNLELERRAVKAEEEAKQKDDDVRQKEQEIAALRQQVEHYESRLLECEVKMKSVEEELKKQITALQMAQHAGARTDGSTTSHHRPELSGGVTPSRSLATRAEEAYVKHQEHNCEPVVGEKQTKVDRLIDEFRRESRAFEQSVKTASEAKPSAKSVDELKVLKRQFGIWRKQYEARLHKSKVELKKRVDTEKRHGQDHSNRRRWSWWKIKVPKCNPPKCFKVPSPYSFCFCCCLRRCS